MKFLVCKRSNNEFSEAEYCIATLRLMTGGAAAGGAVAVMASAFNVVAAPSVFSYGATIRPL